MQSRHIRMNMIHLEDPLGADLCLSVLRSHDDESSPRERAFWRIGKGAMRTFRRRALSYPRGTFLSEEEDRRAGDRTHSSALADPLEDATRGDRARASPSLSVSRDQHERQSELGGILALSR